jgi:hypothetical protein
MEKGDMLKLFQELGEGGIKEKDGGSEFNYGILYELCKCHNV